MAESPYTRFEVRDGREFTVIRLPDGPRTNAFQRHARKSKAERKAEAKARAVFAHKHDLSCFVCDLKKGPWARVGVNSRGPWAKCVRCPKVGAPRKAASGTPSGGVSRG